MLESTSLPANTESTRPVAAGPEQEHVYTSLFFPGPYFGAPFIYPRPFFYFGFFPIFRPFGRFGPF